MRSITLIILLHLSSFCHAQSHLNRCDTLTLDKHSRNVLGVREATLEEYLQNRGIKATLISDRKSLRRFNTLLCNESEVILLDTVQQDQVIELNFRKGKEAFRPADFLMPNSKGENSFLLYNEDEAPYGFVSSDTVVITIEKLTIQLNGQELPVPTKVYDDLFFPNFCNTDISIKPIQTFISKNGKEIFIYIFGENRSSREISYHLAFQYSYMAKLVIDLEKGYQERIVLRGNELSYFNWEDCFNFRGF